jgi:hypothetical protein
MEQNNALMRGVAMAVHTNPDLHQALREVVVEPELVGFQRILDRAIARGEVRPDNPALKYMVHMMLGAFVTRALIEDLPPTQAFLRSYIDAVVVPALGV